MPRANALQGLRKMMAKFEVPDLLLVTPGRGKKPAFMETVEVLALAGGVTDKSAYGAFCLTSRGLIMEYGGQNYPCGAVLPIQNQA